MIAMFSRKAGSPRFGRFELRERIGEGGMGIVYRTFDPQLERTVAVKLIDTRAFPASQRERTPREARSLARLAHLRQSRIVVPGTYSMAIHTRASSTRPRTW
ncbi:hypothetical protein OV203_21315 [Nannocystis sp. ILAH1]|uniref:hypothetical protein n=1 Tax=Nannocystis sp. ILAH1 TaxID=2996789 RepID=UPI00226FA078|nr:hypothetical protein [Nannocystis sp. ILAH1]MCY0989692.1 hypothetical protein [Nannocystis sp. ILAH1]